MNFDNQFNQPKLKIDVDKEYYYAPGKSCRGFTNLMKLVLMASDNLVLDNIKKESKETPLTINKANQHGWTALMIAVRNSNTKSSESIVKLLIEEKADVDARNSDGMTPLMIASMNSGKDSTENTVRLLLSANALVNSKDGFGRTALMHVCGDDFVSTPDTIKILANAGANVNEVGAVYKKSAIMIACESKNSDDVIVSIIKHLIEVGADYSSNMSDIKMVKFILKANQKIISEIKEQARVKQKVIEYDGSWMALVTKAL